MMTRSKQPARKQAADNEQDVESMAAIPDQPRDYSEEIQRMLSKLEELKTQNSVWFEAIVKYDLERDIVHRQIEHLEVITFFKTYSKGQTVPEKGIELLNKIKEFNEKEKKQRQRGESTQDIFNQDHAGILTNLTTGSQFQSQISLFTNEVLTRL